jgi:proteasome lid subunit RPN8/RPN11
VTPEILEILTELGKQALPNEACGVVIEYPCGHFKVYELLNESDTPTTASVLSTTELLATVPEDIIAAIRPEDMVIWHTHPSGAIGPSKKDMMCRPSDPIGARIPHLVVAMPNGEATLY